MPNSLYQTLRTAISKSNLTDDVISQLDDRGVFVSSEEQAAAGRGKSPLTVVRGPDGKVTKYWRTEEDRRRQQKLAKYEKIFLDGIGAFQSEWYKNQSQKYDDQVVYHAYNLIHLVSEVNADLIVGGGCTVDTGIEPLDKLLNDRMQLGARVREWRVMASVFGYLGVQVSIDPQRGRLDLMQVLPKDLFVYFVDGSADEWYCIAKKTQIAREEIPETETLEGYCGAEIRYYVIEERHFEGWYENYLWAVGDDDKIVGNVPLEYWDPALKRVVMTGLSDFAITIIANRVTINRFRSDWDDILDINYLVNDRASREGGLLNKYAGPNLLLPDSMAMIDPVDRRAFFESPRDGVWFRRPTDTEKPEYLQPSADTQSSRENFKQLLNLFSVLSGLPSFLLDSAEAGQVQSGVAYKMRMTPAINKANAKRPSMVRAMQRIVFNVLSALDYYGEHNVRDEYLSAFQSRLQNLLNEDQLPEEVQSRLAALKSQNERRGLGVSLESFAKYFQGTKVANLAPEGVYLDDPSQQMDPSKYNMLATPEMLARISESDLFAQEVFSLGDVSIDMRPALPQDTQLAIDRLNGKASISLHRVLTEVDNLSEKEAEQEIIRIEQDEARGVSESGMGFGMEFSDVDSSEVVPQNDLDGNGLQGIQPTDGNPEVAVPNEFTGE